jgi:hypothetical protein
MKPSVSFRLLDLGELEGLLGWVISSSQGDCYDGEVGGMNGLLAGESEVLGENLP